MSHKKASDYIDLIRMPPGRCFFALTEAKTQVDELSIEALRAPIDGALERAREALDVDMRWTMERNRSTGRGQARPIKAAAVRQLGSLSAILEARTVGDADDPIVRQAGELIDVAFPEGVRAFADQPYEVFLGSVQTLLARLEGPQAGHVRAVGVEREVRRLSALVGALREELRPGAQSALDYEDVLAAREAVHEATCRVVAHVLVHLDGGGEDGARRRERVLAELNRQQALVSESFRRNGQPLDVDPETGEDLDPEVPPTPGDDPTPVVDVA